MINLYNFHYHIFINFIAIDDVSCMKTYKTNKNMFILKI